MGNTFFIDESIREKLLNALDNIYSILRDEGFSKQAEYIARLIFPLTTKDDLLFKSRALSAEVWGGAGAVWEVDIRDYLKREEFRRNILIVLESMIQQDIKFKSINTVYKFFKQE